MDTYSSRLRAVALLALFAGVVAGIVGGQLLELGKPGEQFWLLYPALLALWGLALAAGLPWWRRLDDVQRAGHLTACYWGGQAGMLAVMMGLIAATGPRSALSLGSLVTVVGIATGYLIFYAGWRLRQRGPEE
jgi:hypothetical protein